jgi:hypothetical protein
VSQFKHQAETLNTVLNRENYHFSYNPSSAGYGTQTSAIVLKERVFLILTGDHREQLEATQSLQQAFDYFVENIDKAHDYSEHTQLTGQRPDAFGLITTALETLGSANLERLNP